MEKVVAKARPEDPARIVRDPRVMGGKPVVKGTRIPVELVLDYLATNPKFNDLFADYPRLTIEDVKACLAFAQLAVERRGEDAAPRGDPLSDRA
ncbi:MAG TPA: DUF433 domain-containing protein [Dehalococcoidia bacterium]|nr:DUF433 domain-containing protein [Dehalococcoidia bacterium]